MANRFADLHPEDRPSIEALAAAIEGFQRVDQVRGNQRSFQVNEAGRVVGLSLFQSRWQPEWGEHLQRLPHLDTLLLWGCGIEDAGPLASLTALTRLNLFGNQISDGGPLASLTALTTLGLSHNKISDAGPLASLTALTRLELRDNKISDGGPLASLTALTTLDLTNNKISDGGPLASLTALTHLDLRGNRLSALPAELCGRFARIQLGYDDDSLCLGGNPLRHPPIELVARGKAAVDAWFAVFDRFPSRELGQLKVLLVGEGAAGKTSLVERIVDDRFDPQQAKTDGIRVVDWQPELAGDDLLVKFWDFGGQEIMHATHQFFLSKRGLYLVVQSARHDDKTAYWLRHVTTFGGAAPVLVVINGIDENPGFQLDEHQLRRDYPNILGFYRISCKSGEGLPGLIDRLKQELPAVELARALWPEPWFQTKLHMEGLSAPYLEQEQSHAICAEHGIDDPVYQKVFLEYLHDLGVMLSFPDRQLRLTKVLEPRWATEGVYQIINAKALAEDHGCLALDRLAEILDSELYPAQTHDFLIALMRKFELCYPIDHEGERVMVPNLLPKSSPASLDLPGEGSELRFLFHYPHFLPPAVFLRTMVRLYRDIRGHAWRHGVFLSNGAHHALITEDVDQRMLHLRVRGPRPRDYFNLLYYTIGEINDSFASLDVEEKVPLPDQPLHRAAAYESLLAMARDGVQHHYVHQQKYALTELLGGLHSENPQDLAREVAGLRDVLDFHTEVVQANENRLQSIAEALVKDPHTRPESVAKGAERIQPESYRGVALCGSFEGLAEHHAILEDALKRWRLVPLTEKYRTATADGDEVDYARNAAQEGAAAICLISHHYGQVPEDPERNPEQWSRAQLTFEAAQELGRPTLVFIMGEHHPVTKAYVEQDPKRQKSLEAFRERAKAGRIYVTFESLEEFKEKALHAVARLKTDLTKS